MSITGPAGRIGKIIGPGGPIGRVIGPQGVVWESWVPRSVTIITTASGWNTSRISGDTSLVSSSSTTGLYFEEDVICDTDTRTGSSTTRSGNRITAGTRIQPSTPVRTGQSYTFTSVK